MKKKLIEAIKAQFVGIDDNTAKRLAERIIRKGEPLTTDDEVSAAVEKMTWSDVIKSVGDFSADDAVRRYEEKHGIKDGKPLSKDDDDDKKQPKPKTDDKGGKGDGDGDDDSKGKELKELVSSIFKDLTKDLSTKMDQLSGDLAAIKSGKRNETRKSRLESVIKDLKETQKKAYNRLSFEGMSDEDFEKTIGEIQEEVNEIVAENKASGVTPPLGGIHREQPTGTATESEIDAVVGKLANR